MTRLQYKQMQEAIQQSANATAAFGPSSSSTDPSSSTTWFRGDRIKADANAMQPSVKGLSGVDFLSSTMGSETITSYEDAVPQKGGLKDGLKELGTVASTDDYIMRAHELGLAPSPPGFFDSSQEASQAVRHNAASRQKSNNMAVVIPPRPSSARSISGATPSKRNESSASSADPATPGEKNQARGSKVTRKGSVAPSDASISIDVENPDTPSARPRRGAAARMDYSAPWNLDGTEIKSSSKKAKNSRMKESLESSSNVVQSSRKGSEAETPIVVDDEDDVEDEEESLPAEKVIEVSEHVVEHLSKLGKDMIESEQGEPESVVGVASDDEEEVVLSRKRDGKERSKARKSAAMNEDVEMESDGEASGQFSSTRKTKEKKTNARKGKKRLEDSDEEGSRDQATLESSREGNAIPDVVVEIQITEARGGKKAGKGAKAKSKQVVVDEEEEEEEDIPPAEEEEIEKEDVQQSKGSKLKLKTKAAVLADASSAVNARSLGVKAVEIGTSSTSTPPPKSTLLDAAKRFWGKPLSSLLGPNQHRSPGLAKRKIAPLLAIRNAPPPKRAAIPIPKSRQKNKDEDLDSDEETSRANETPEERMARYIREQDEGD